MSARPPDASPRSLIDQASALLDAHRPGDAVPLLQQAIARDPQPLRARCLLALAYHRLRKPKESLAAADGAAATSPANDWPHRLRALALLELRRGPEAVTAASEAVRLAPNSAESHVLYSSAVLSVGDRDLAYRAAERARELRPDRPLGHVQMSHVELRKLNWQAAEHHARDALALEPENPTALNNLGVALRHQGKRSEAVHYLSSASRIDPRSSLYRRNAQRAAARGAFIVGPLAVLAIFASLVSAGEAGALAAAYLVAALGFAGMRRVLRPRRSAPVQPTPARAPTADPKASPALMQAVRRDAWQSARQVRREFFSLGHLRRLFLGPLMTYPTAVLAAFRAFAAGVLVLLVGTVVLLPVAALASLAYPQAWRDGSLLGVCVVTALVAGLARAIREFNPRHWWRSWKARQALDRAGR